MKMLTEKQAYAAMFYFLKKLYERTNSSDLGSCLSDMSLLQNGSTADPAVKGDWAKAVDYALNGGEAGKLQLKPSQHK